MKNRLEEAAKYKRKYTDELLMKTSHTLHTAHSVESVMSQILCNLDDYQTNLYVEMHKKQYTVIEMTDYLADIVSLALFE